MATLQVLRPPIAPGPTQSPASSESETSQKQVIIMTATMAVLIPLAVVLTSCFVFWMLRAKRQRVNWLGRVLCPTLAPETTLLVAIMQVCCSIPADKVVGQGHPVMKWSDYLHVVPLDFVCIPKRHNCAVHCCDSPLPTHDCVNHKWTREMLEGSLGQGSWDPRVVPHFHRFDP